MKNILILFFLCITAITYGQDTNYVCHQERVEIYSLENLNTKSIEFSPAFYQTGIVFVVAREKNQFIDPSTGRAYFDLMYSDIGPEGEVSKSMSFSPNIRTQYHEGPCTFDKEGQEMFFTRSHLSGTQGVSDEKGMVQLKIYSANKGPEDWEGVTALPFCDDKHTYAHPALSADGNYLVFSSDREGGYGGMDLYVVSRENDVWSEPVNLGPGINTTGHEVFPNWHIDNYLFFSSDGHDGIGGLDHFVTYWNLDKKFVGIQHLSEPFNSKQDDLGLIVNADGVSGYFASNRKPTKGKDDLYRWNCDHSIFCNPPIRLQPYELMVYNTRGEAIENSAAWVIPMDQQGPVLFKDNFNIEVLPDPEKKDDFLMKWTLKDTLSSSTAQAFSNREGKLMLQAEPNGRYALLVQRSGYQPSFETYWEKPLPNRVTLQKLPEASAPCLASYFTVYNEKGDTALNGARIKLLSNCFDGPKVFYTKEDGTAYNCLEQGCQMKAEIVQEGYAPHSYTFTPTEPGEHWKIYLKSSDMSGPVAPIASGTIIVLDNIYYDFNQSAIRKGDAEELIALAQILNQYPELTIELTSHTDTRGTSEYNMALSDRRSQSSKDYLVLLGVNASRIKTKAAGESTPRNKCVDGVPCTETEHQYNRRTEVRIINPRQGMEIKYKNEG